MGTKHHNLLYLFSYELLSIKAEECLPLLSTPSKSLSLLHIYCQADYQIFKFIGLQDLLPSFKMHTSLLPFVTLLSQVHAIPALLVPRDDPCTKGGNPILYKTYGTDQCPPINTVDASGDCPVPGGTANCASFCQQTTTYQYVQEVPVGGGVCHGPLTCAVSAADTKTWTWNGGGSIGGTLLEVLNIGVTGGFSVSGANTQTTTKTIALQQGQCGYMTFLPTTKTTWFVGRTLPTRIPD